eukprot:scaffold6931_cov443-Prasinococcus_capsulatus_cf.AAC.9
MGTAPSQCNDAGPAKAEGSFLSSRRPIARRLHARVQYAQWGVVLPRNPSDCAHLERRKGRGVGPMRTPLRSDPSSKCPSRRSTHCLICVLVTCT